MGFNWIKSIITNAGFYSVFTVLFYFAFNKLRSKTETTGNTYAFIYSLFVNIICLGIVLILSNPNLDGNTWSFMLFSAPAVFALPSSVFAVSLVPVVLMCLMPLVLIFHTVKIDVYIGVIGISFASLFLFAGCFQYFALGWTVKHGFNALKGVLKGKGKIIAVAIFISAVILMIGVIAWAKMHDMLDALYLDKRQEIKYW
jgi:hypothetical protein